MRLTEGVTVQRRTVGKLGGGRWKAEGGRSGKGFPLQEVMDLQYMMVDLESMTWQGWIGRHAWLQMWQVFLHLFYYIYPEFILTETMHIK